jgi:hypothetical protein
MFQHVRRLTVDGSLPEHLPQVSEELLLRVIHYDPTLPSPICLQCQCDWLSSLLCCRHTLAQDVFLPMPLLTHLNVEGELTGQAAKLVTAIQLGTLQSLGVRMDRCPASLLQACTQLKALHLFVGNWKGASAIAQLTGLTRLNLFTASYTQLFSAAEQSELGSALAALSNIQSLHLSNAPPGPVAQALSQLTALTELALFQQSIVPNPDPLNLPSCVRLTFWNRISVRHLASIQAPKLQYLDVSLAVKPSDLDGLKLLCKGVLKACSSLGVNLEKAWSSRNTVALMAMISQDWQPSAQALQPIRSTLGLTSSSNIPRQWNLTLQNAHCSRQCLELLPKGLGSLHLRWVLWLHVSRFEGPPTCTGQYPLPSLPQLYPITVTVVPPCLVSPSGRAPCALTAWTLWLSWPA